MSDKLTIEQRHKDAAASYGLWRIYSGLGAEGIKEGRADHDDLVQAFAQFEADCLRTPTPEQAGEVEPDEIVGHWHYLAGQPSGVFMSDPVDEASLKHGWGSYPLYRKPYPHVASTPPAQPTSCECVASREAGAMHDTDCPSIAQPTAEAVEGRTDADYAWVVPRHATEAMMDAGLYHCSADMKWEDLFTAFHYMVDQAEQDRPDALPTMAGDYVMLEKITHENGPVVVDWWGENLSWRPLDYGNWTPIAASPTGGE